MKRNKTHLDSGTHKYNHSLPYQEYNYMHKQRLYSTVQYTNMNI